MGGYGRVRKEKLLLPTGNESAVDDDVRREYEKATVYFDQYREKLFEVRYWPPSCKWIWDSHFGVLDAA